MWPSSVYGQARAATSDPRRSRGARGSRPWCVAPNRAPRTRSYRGCRRWDDLSYQPTPCGTWGWWPMIASTKPVLHDRLDEAARRAARRVDVLGAAVVRKQDEVVLGARLLERAAHEVRPRPGDVMASLVLVEGALIPDVRDREHGDARASRVSTAGAYASLERLAGADVRHAGAGEVVDRFEQRARAVVPGVVVRGGRRRRSPLARARPRHPEAR